MSSTTRLLVLGVVHLFQPVHGYDVRRELVSWHAHEWASVKPGSIYNALKSLTREGLLEVVGIDQVGSRPERTSYRLTATGTKEFRKHLREEWWTVRSPIDPLLAALSFINFVPRAEAIAALEQRQARIHGITGHLEAAAQDIDGVETPFHVREMHRLLIARINAELEWSRPFIERLRKGEYTTADDPQWQPVLPPPVPRAARRASTARSTTADTTGVAGRERARGNAQRRTRTAEAAPGTRRGSTAPRARGPRRKRTH